MNEYFLIQSYTSIVFSYIREKTFNSITFREQTQYKNSRNVIMKKQFFTFILVLTRIRIRIRIL
jgi:hypothetical protein